MAADVPAPNVVVLETPAGVAIHPLPLPGRVTPEAWVAGLGLPPEVASQARWTLGVAAERSMTATPTQPWAAVVPP